MFTSCVTTDDANTNQNPQTCTEQQVDDYLMECVWNVVNFNGSNDLLPFELDFQDNQHLQITENGNYIVANWQTSQNASGDVQITFDGVAMGTIQAISGVWTVVECAEDRFVLENANGDEMVLERDCNSNTNPSTCTEQQVDDYLMECVWVVANTLGGADLSSFELDFQDNQHLQITENGNYVVANWQTSQNASGDVQITFDGVAMGGIQAISGVWTVVECADDRFVLENANGDEMVLERDCS